MEIPVALYKVLLSFDKAEISSLSSRQKGVLKAVMSKWTIDSSEEELIINEIVVKICRSNAQAVASVETPRIHTPPAHALVSIGRLVLRKATYQRYTNAGGDTSP